MAIPRIFHQIWLERDRFPAEYRRRQETWLAKHPEWELRFWTDENLPPLESLQRVEVAERLRFPAERTDLLRLEVLRQLGGVYVDAGLECLRSIEPLIGDASLVIGRSSRGRVDTAFIAAAAGHPILERALEQIRPREFPGYDKDATGSRFLDRILADADGVKFVDRALVNPSRPEDVARAYAAGGGEGWESLDRLWQSLLKSEKRLRAAQKQAAHWKARYEESAAGKGAEAAARGDRSSRAPASGAARKAESLRIPRIFHCVWLGPRPLPEEYAEYQQSWRRHHPDWELRLWTEDTLPSPLRRPEAAERLRIPAERSDILRLEVVWRHGGVYLDADLECRAPIEELIAGTDFFSALSGSGIADFYLFGATPQHPILDRALDLIRPQKRFGYKKTRTGPRFLNSMIADKRDEIRLLTPPMLRGYTSHHEHRTYLDLTELQLEIQTAKLKLLEATAGA